MHGTLKVWSPYLACSPPTLLLGAQPPCCEKPKPHGVVPCRCTVRSPSWTQAWSHPGSGATQTSDESLGHSSLQTCSHLLAIQVFPVRSQTCWAKTIYPLCALWEALNLIKWSFNATKFEVAFYTAVDNQNKAYFWHSGKLAPRGLGTCPGLHYWVCWGSPDLKPHALSLALHYHYKETSLWEDLFFCLS